MRLGSAWSEYRGRGNRPVRRGSWQRTGVLARAEDMACGPRVPADLTPFGRRRMEQTKEKPSLDRIPDMETPFG
jgi:hypothetical protein